MPTPPQRPLEIYSLLHQTLGLNISLISPTGSHHSTLHTPLLEIHLHNKEPNGSIILPDGNSKSFKFLTNTNILAFLGSSLVQQPLEPHPDWYIHALTQIIQIRWTHQPNQKVLLSEPLDNSVLTIMLKIYKDGRNGLWSFDVLQDDGKIYSPRKQTHHQRPYEAELHATHFALSNGFLPNRLPPQTTLAWLVQHHKSERAIRQLTPRPLRTDPSLRF